MMYYKNKRPSKAGRRVFLEFPDGSLIRHDLVDGVHRSMSEPVSVIWPEGRLASVGVHWGTHYHAHMPCASEVQARRLHERVLAAFTGKLAEGVTCCRGRYGADILSIAMPTEEAPQ